jgi:hypothetical protein
MDRSQLIQKLVNVLNLPTFQSEIVKTDCGKDSENGN